MRLVSAIVVGALAILSASAVQASVRIVTYEDVPLGPNPNIVPVDGLQQFDNFIIIGPSDPHATGTSGNESFSPGPSPITLFYGGTSYFSIDVNAPVSTKLVFEINDLPRNGFIAEHEIQFTFTTDSDGSGFETLTFPTLPWRTTYLKIGAASAFSLDNLVYARPDAWGAVPEPSAWTLGILGFAAAGSALRRRGHARLARG